MARQLQSVQQLQRTTREPSLAQKIWTGLSGVVSQVEQPFVSLAAKPVQIAAKAAGLADPYAGGIPSGLPGGDTTSKITPASLKGTAGDALKVAATVGSVAAAPATIGTAALTGAGIGASQFAGSALQEEKPLPEVLKQGAIGGALGAATSGVIAGIGKLFSYAGDKIMKGVIKPGKVDLEDGFSLDTIKEYNLGGSLNTIQQRTQKKLTELSDELNGKLAESSVRIDLNDVFDQTVRELTDSSKFKGFGANIKVQAGLQQLKNEVQFLNETGSVSIPEAQIVKQASGSFGAWQFQKPDADSKATEIIYNAFYRKLKTAIEDGSPPGVETLNKELSKLIPVMNAIIRRLPVAERSNIISLNEMIGLVGSTMNPVALGPTLLAVISRSGAAANTLSKASGPIVRSATPASLATSLLGERVQETVQSQ